MIDYRELTHPTRISILKSLESEPKGVTDIANEINSSRPEVSRHLTALRKLNMVDKEESSNFITEFGYLILKIISPLDFLLEYDEYFMEHPLVNFPTQFLYDLNKLRGNELIEGSGYFFQKQIELGPIASDKMKLMINSPIPNVSGVCFDEGQLIVRENPNMKVLTHDNLKKDMKHYEIRQYSGIHYIIYIMGDKFGFLHFPNKEGFPDVNSCLFVYTGEGIQYLLSLWDYYWSRAKKVVKYPKESL